MIAGRRAVREWRRGGGSPFSVRRALYEPAGFDSLCVTGGAVSVVGTGWAMLGALDAPICIPAGACRDLSPFWFHGDGAQQMVVAREGWK